MDLKHSIDNFLYSITANGYSDSTRDLYSWALNLLCTYMNNPDIKAIKPDTMDLFWGWLRNDYTPKRMNGNTKPLSGRSLENIWTAERSFFGWCKKKDYIKKRPDLDIKKPEYTEREVEPITEEELDRMIMAAQRTRIANTTGRSPFTSPRPTAKRDAAIIMLLGETGIRVSECARLIRSDVDFDEGKITIQPWGSGKKTKYRKLDIGRKTRLALWEYLAWREEKEGRAIENDELVFYSLLGNPMNKDSIRQVLVEIGKAADVKGSANPHRFRHFFASMSAADDMAEDEMKEKLGHTSGKMARRYVHLHSVNRKKRPSIIDRVVKKNK